MSYDGETFHEVKDYIIANWDTVDFLERFNISIEQLVDAFPDLIYEREEELAEEFQDELPYYDSDDEETEV
jgi:hypothetical protein